MCDKAVCVECEQDNDNEGHDEVCSYCAEENRQDDELTLADFDFEDHDPEFAYPGGNSALRAETPSNPRNLPCPTCKSPNRLTPKDKALGYHCDGCADRAERGGY